MHQGSIFQRSALVIGIIIVCSGTSFAQTSYRTSELVPLKRSEHAGPFSSVPQELAGHQSSTFLNAPSSRRGTAGANDQDPRPGLRYPDDQDSQGMVSPASYPGETWQDPGEEPATVGNGESDPLGRMKQAFGETDRRQFDLSQTIQKIAWSTLAVLVICGVVLFGMKKLGITPPGVAPEGDANSKIRETITLGPKCVMQLVQIGGHRVAVVRDATGIKSVLHLPRQFEEEMESFSRNAA